MGVVLGLVLSIVVVVVLGGLSGFQQRREIRREREAREALLVEAIVPLAAWLESAPARTELRERLTWVEAAWRARGHEDHALVVRDGDGLPILVAPPGGAFEPPEGALKAEIRLNAPWSQNGAAILQAWQDADELRLETASRWRMWWLDLLVASGAVIVAVQIAVHLLVGRPLGRLVRGLRHLELGYVRDLDCGPGAWELRWLAWRFRHLGRELADQARRLVLAERRALEASGTLVRRPTAVAGPGGPPARVPAPEEEEESDRGAMLLHQYLQDSCRLLERMRPNDLLADKLAEDAWNRLVIEAEQLGDFQLKARLDDAALRVLEPEASIEIERRFAALRASRRGWEREVLDRLESALRTAGVPHDDIHGRVKNTAGVWRKMHERQLELEQIHDLFAFRIVVPEEADCYLALAAVHRQFEAEPFRFKDYIAEPKANGYRSLHTTLRDEAGRLFEVQIRSRSMHVEAEGGLAAHWRYSATRWRSFARLRRQARWRRFLRRLLRQQRERALPDGGVVPHR